MFYLSLKYNNTIIHLDKCKPKCIILSHIFFSQYNWRTWKQMKLRLPRYKYCMDSSLHFISVICNYDLTKTMVRARFPKHVRQTEGAETCFAKLFLGIHIFKRSPIYKDCFPSNRLMLTFKVITIEKIWVPWSSCLSYIPSFAALLSSSSHSTITLTLLMCSAPTLSIKMARYFGFNLELQEILLWAFDSSI